MKSRHARKQGFLLVAMVVVLLIVAALSLALVEMTLRESDTQALTTNKHKSVAIARAALARALKYLGTTGNWSAVPATIFNNLPLGDGTYTVTSRNHAQDSITIDITGMVGISRTVLTRDISLDDDPDHGGFLTFDSYSTVIAAKKIHKLHINSTNIHADIVIDNVRLSMSPTGGENITLIDFGRTTGALTTIWSGFSSPGIWLDVLNSSLSPGLDYQIQFRTDTNLTGTRDYTLDIQLTDGSIHTEHFTETGPSP